MGLGGADVEDEDEGAGLVAGWGGEGVDADGGDGGPFAMVRVFVNALISRVFLASRSALEAGFGPKDSPGTS